MQVLSESVAKTMKWYNERSTQTRDTRATEQFVLLMDRFFDMFNVRGLTEGKRTRKATRDPYWSAKDWRFEVSYCMGLGYTDTQCVLHIGLHSHMYIYINYTLCSGCRMCSWPISRNGRMK